MVFLPYFFLLSIVAGCQTLITPDVRNKVQHVNIDTIPEHCGEKMQHYLENLMQTDGKNPWYSLKVSFDTWDQNRVFGEGGKSIVKAEKTIVRYTLTRIKDRKILLCSYRMIRGIRPFSMSPYAQTIAKEHQLDQSLRIIAYDIVRHVAQTLRNTQTSMS